MTGAPAARAAGALLLKPMTPMTREEPPKMLNTNGPRTGPQWEGQTYHNSAQCVDCEDGHPGYHGRRALSRQTLRDWAKAHARRTGHHVNLIQTTVVTFGPGPDATE